MNLKLKTKNLKPKLITKNFLVFVIVVLAFLLRVYKVSEYPAGLNADEAAIGYNAYSLLNTGKDEFGHPWPINFQSFNDFKPGLYFYLVLPFVKVLGLTELAVRLPSVILGTLTVLLTYLLTRRLTLKLTLNNADHVPLTTALLLAVSPWHLHFSRGGWESNAALFFMTLGVYLFYISVKNPKIFTFCVLSFVLSMYTYHSARVIVPLLALGLIIFKKKEIFVAKNFKWLVVACLLGGIAIIPVAKSFLSKEGSARFTGVGILADQGPLWRANELRGQHPDFSSLFPRILHNKYTEYLLALFKNYLSHFGGNFLFISGDEIQRNKVPEMGQMYLAEIAFLVLGICYLFKNRPNNWRFLLWWLAIAPIASAMTFQSPHAIRALNMVIPLAVITAYGLSCTINILLAQRSRFKIGEVGLSCCIAIAFLWNISFYLHQYYVHYPQVYPAAWEYGFRDLVKYVEENESKYANIYVTNKYDQPYILFAFYLKYPPQKFQKEARLTPRDQYGFSTVETFGKYHFGPIRLDTLPKEKKIMVVGTFSEIPDSATIVKRIYFKDGKTEAFRIIEN